MPPMFDGPTWGLANECFRSVAVQQSTTTQSLIRVSLWTCPSRRVAYDEIAKRVGWLHKICSDDEWGVRRPVADVHVGDATTNTTSLLVDSCKDLSLLPMMILNSKFLEPAGMCWAQGGGCIVPLLNMPLYELNN